MKKILVLLCVLLVNYSASARRLGMFCYFADDGSQVFENDSVKLHMDGTCLLFENKKNGILYVDMGNSFAYIGDSPENLYQARAKTKGKVSSSGVSYNLGAIGRAIGVGGTSAQILNGINVGSSSGSYEGTTTFEKRYVPVAPNSHITVYKWDQHLNIYMEGNGLIHTDNPTFWKTSRQPRFIDQEGRETKAYKGLKRFYSKERNPLELKAIVSYSENENDSNLKTVRVSNYICEIEIGSYKGCVEAYNKYRDLEKETWLKHRPQPNRYCLNYVTGCPSLYTGSVAIPVCTVGLIGTLYLISLTSSK